MKKLFILLIAVLGLTAAAPQAQADKAASQLRIYINPGHGSWGPNDRPMATISYPMLSSTGRPDTCGFYESNTNLWKAFGMREALMNMGVQSSNIMLSRWANGPYPYVSGASNESQYNRNLSEICEEVESNNMDMFVSIHSDATGTDDLVNRGLFLYRGYDNGKTGDAGYTGNAVPGSYDMCNIVWESHYMDEIDPQSNYKRTGTTYSKYIKGDITFYGESNCSWSTRNNGNSYFGYLGVLKHGVPGFLMEGYVHTYEPARHRALNQDYCRQEGVRTARGVARYWNFSGESTGYIMGAVKDAVNSLENNLYTYRSGSVDAKAPINGATVQLYDSNNTLIDTYHTDGNYNGVFVFNNLTPGNYSVKVIKEGFADNTASVTVTANATAYPIVYMSAGTSGEPTGDIITSLDFENEATTYSTISGNVISTAQYGETTVVLTDVPMLYAIDNSTKSISTVPITGLEAQNGLGGTVLFPLRSVAFTSDGKLIGCNKTLNQDSGIGDSDYGVTQQGQIQFYYWNNLTSAPTKWVSSKNAANFYEARMGDAMTVEGTLANCLVTVSGITAQGSQISYRLVSFAIVNSAITRTSVTIKTVSPSTSLYTTNTIGQKISLTASPRVSGNAIIDGELTQPIEVELYASNGNAPSDPSRVVFNGSGIDAASNRANYTTYSGRKIMIAPVTTSAGANTGVKLYDITSGLASPSNITTSGTTLSSASTTYTAAHSYVNGDDLIMYLVKDNTIVRFAPTEGSTVVDTSPIRGIFAYGLSSTVNDDDSYTFTYGANNNATETYIVFNDATTGTQVGRVKVANAVMSRQRNANTFNSVTLTQDQIPGSEGQILNWSVELKGRPVAATGTRLNNLSNTTNKYNYTRIGIAVDNSPESDHFGYVYVVDRVGSSNANNSITQWFQGTTDTQDSNYSDWGFTGKYTSTTKFHNPFRAAVDDKGTVYLADYGDGANSGIRIFQPETMETSTQLFTGTNNSSTGAWTTSGGVFVGGSCAGVAITGSGANKVLYTTIEDNADQKNQIAVYNIGNATTWGTAPSRYISTGGIILNGNQCLYADDKGGVWISQYRYGTANDYGVPALIYIDASGSITCNMGYQNSTLKGCHAAGFAVSPDNSLLAVINGSSEICLYSLAWSGTTPTPTYITKFTCEATGGTTTNAVYQMAFDWGGNLYAGGTKLVVYSIADAENRHTTPAKKVLTVTKLGSRSLAQIANGSNVVVNTKYRISNTDLVCVYVDKTAQTIYCKDNNQAANKSYLAEGQTDYLYKVGLQTTEPDQSNWVAVHLPQALTAAQISAMVNHNVTIKAGTVNVKGGNNEITLTTMPIPGSTATYTPNTYITANFVSENWSNPDFFFVKPKPMEYAIVKWAVWDADNNVFVIPAKQGGNNIAGLHGGFAINTSLEETNYSFVDGQLYTLEGIVKEVSGGSGLPRRIQGDGTVISSNYVFYPTIATNDTPTDIDKIFIEPAQREIVAVKYFGLTGIEYSEAPNSGIYIEVTYYSDGSHESVKKQAHR